MANLLQERIYCQVTVKAQPDGPEELGNCVLPEASLLL